MLIKRIVESVSEPTMSVGSFFREKYGIKKKLLRLSNLPYYKEDFVYTNMYRYFCGQECWKIKKRNIVPLLMEYPTKKI